MKFSRFPVFVLLGLLACGLSACKEKNDPQAAAGGPPAMPVTIAQPLTKDIQEWDEFTGRFEAVDKVDVRSRVSGYLESVHFKEGSMVKKGDLLFIIDPRPYAAALRKAQADMQSAAAMQDFAEQEFVRYQNLLKTGTISEKLFEEKTQNKIDTAARLSAAKSAVEAARLDVEFTRITAPIDGRISSKYVSEGNVVQGGPMNATLLTTLVSLNPIHFVFDVDEATYLKYSRLAKEGERPSSREHANPVYVALADEKDFTRAGTMNFVDNEIDHATGTMRGRAVFKNDDLMLTPGMFGRARIIGSGLFRAILIPDEATTTDQGRKLVLTVTDAGDVVPRPITVGRMAEGLRVVTDGLKGDEWIIVNGLQRAQPGMKVAPQKTVLQTSGELQSAKEAPSPASMPPSTAP